MLNKSIREYRLNRDRNFPNTMALSVRGKDRRRRSVDRRRSELQEPEVRAGMRITRAKGTRRAK
jgi:hypothetical protein